MRRRCPPGSTGGVGLTGPAGLAGIAGIAGIAGLAGVSGFANFFALMPGDNAATIAAGAPINFPQNGPTSVTSVERVNATTFRILRAGTYQINWQASIAEAGQLVVAVNSVEIAATVVGRATGTSQIVGSTLLTLAVGDLVQIRNPTGNAAALTLTPIAGGTHAVSATLTFVRLG